MYFRSLILLLLVFYAHSAFSEIVITLTDGELSINSETADEETFELAMSSTEFVKMIKKISSLRSDRYTRYGELQASDKIQFRNSRRAITTNDLNCDGACGMGCYGRCCAKTLYFNVIEIFGPSIQYEPSLQKPEDQENQIKVKKRKR